MNAIVPVSFSAPPQPDLTSMHSGVMLLAAPAAGPGKAEEIDGELLSAYRQWLPWEALRVEGESMCDRARATAGAARVVFDAEADAMFDAYTDDWHVAVVAIVNMRAATPEGVVAKAHVLRSLIDNHVGICMLGEAETRDQLAYSLVRDIVGAP